MSLCSDRWRLVVVLPRANPDQATLVGSFLPPISRGHTKSSAVIDVLWSYQA
jgi:hypothetical protein